MSTGPAARPDTQPQAWPGALMRGGAGALVIVAIVLTLGLPAFGPLGIAAAAVGLPAAFACVTVGAAVYAIASRSALPAGGPSSATALIFAALVARRWPTAGRAGCCGT
jgi:hypothetical protein